MSFLTPLHKVEVCFEGERDLGLMKRNSLTTLCLKLLLTNAKYYTKLRQKRKHSVELLAYIILFNGDFVAALEIIRPREARLKIL